MSAKNKNTYALCLTLLLCGTKAQISWVNKNKVSNLAGYMTIKEGVDSSLDYKARGTEANPENQKKWKKVIKQAGFDDPTTVFRLLGNQYFSYYPADNKIKFSEIINSDNDSDFHEIQITDDHLRKMINMLIMAAKGELTEADKNPDTAPIVIPGNTTQGINTTYVIDVQRKPPGKASGIFYNDCYSFVLRKSVNGSGLLTQQKKGDIKALIDAKDTDENKAKIANILSTQKFVQAQQEKRQKAATDLKVTSRIVSGLGLFTGTGLVIGSFAGMLFTGGASLSLLMPGIYLAAASAPVLGASFSRVDQITYDNYDETKERQFNISDADKKELLKLMIGAKPAHSIIGEVDGSNFRFRITFTYSKILDPASKGEVVGGFYVTFVSVPKNKDPLIEGQ